MVEITKIKSSELLLSSKIINQMVYHLTGNYGDLKDEYILTASPKQLDEYLKRRVNFYKLNQRVTPNYNYCSRCGPITRTIQFNS